MVARKRSPSPVPPVERRSGRDRRGSTKPPPHGRERRVSIEPRQPEVIELHLSDEEWMALQRFLRANPPR